MFARGGEGLEVSGLSFVNAWLCCRRNLMPHLLIFERDEGITNLRAVVNDCAAGGT